MDLDASTKEPQYQIQLDTAREKGFVLMGPTASHLWRHDPRHLAFLLARYKFCAKMLAGKSSALEVGCGDSFAVGVVLQEVGSVHGIDFDPVFVQWSEQMAAREGLRATYAVGDITGKPPDGMFDAAYSLDVVEHIPAEIEHRYMENICAVLRPDAMCIIGTPNVTSSPYASEWSNEGHINLKSGPELRTLMQRYFDNVLLFSMNDEVVHTGFAPMAHYLFGVGTGLKR